MEAMRLRHSRLLTVEDFRKNERIKMNSDPYDEGWSCGYNDVMPECPYEEGTEEHDDWYSGYKQGSMDC
jgi:hypothetical protein